MCISESHCLFIVCIFVSFSSFSFITYAFSIGRHDQTVVVVFVFLLYSVARLHAISKTREQKFVNWMLHNEHPCILNLCGDKNRHQYAGFKASTK